MDPESPYHGIHIQDFWQVVEDLNDVKGIAPLVTILKSNTLLQYGDYFMNCIEKEAELNRLLYKIVNILDNDPHSVDLKLSTLVPETVLDDAKIISQVFFYTCVAIGMFGK